MLQRGGIARVLEMFAARGNARALDRARRCGRHACVLALCAVGICVGVVTPAQADRIGDTRAEANQVWARIRIHIIDMDHPPDIAISQHIERQ